MLRADLVPVFPECFAEVAQQAHWEGMLLYVTIRKGSRQRGILGVFRKMFSAGFCHF